MSLQDWFGGPYTPDRVTKMTAAIAGIFAVLTITANMLGAGEPYWIATRGYMREHVQKSIERQEISLADARTEWRGVAIRIEEGEARRIRAKIGELELELKKNPSMPESIRRVIDEQIAEQKIELQNKTLIINELRRLQRKTP